MLYCSNGRLAWAIVCGFPMAILCFGAVLLLGACSPKAAPPPAPMTPEQAVETLGQLYRAYSTGTVEEARASLKEMDKYIDHVAHSDDAERCCQYARLHCLAKAAGDDEAAELAFIKARYWRLVWEEQLDSPSRASLLSAMRKFTEYECDRIVILLDQGGGSMPRYWKILFGKDASPEAWLEATYGVKRAEPNATSMSSGAKPG